MSLSWRDEIRIALSPGRVAIARVSGGWRPTLRAAEVVDCRSAAPGDWRACIEALRQALDAPSWQRTRASVVFSNHFARYALVPWSEHLTGDVEKEAWVRHQFQELYDAPDTALDYRWSEEGPGAPCVASAVESDFLAAVRSALEAASLQLLALQPYLMAVFNRWRKQLGPGHVWLVLPEEGRLCLAALAGGAWRAIASKSIGADWRTELPRMLERELVLSGDAAPPVLLVYWPEVPGTDLGVLHELPVRLLEPRRLRGLSAALPGAHAMALAGVI